jgi:excisionase family DNA binding protein
MSQVDALVRDQEAGGVGGTRLLEAAEVANMAGLTPGYVYDLARKGQIPTVKIGRRVRFRPDSIEKWFDDLEHMGAAR